MRIRINERSRRTTSAEERSFYAQRYPDGYHTHQWGDHVQRVAASAEYIIDVIGQTDIVTIGDLSCGDAGIPIRVGQHYSSALILGDLNPCFDAGVTIVGALPGTLEELPSGGVDLYICSETIEHVEDPDFLLAEIRRRAHRLFVSTPVDEPVTYGNLEHYWSWGTDDVELMLRSTGWTPIDHQVFTPDPRPEGGYDFQMWVCE